MGWPFDLFGKKPTPGPRPQPNWPPARQTYPAAWSQPGRGRVPVPVYTPRGRVPVPVYTPRGALVTGAAAGAGITIAAGANPVDATLSAVGSSILGGLGSRFGNWGLVTGSTIGAGLPQALDWLGQHAVLSDRGALKPSSIRVGSIPPTDQRGESYRDAELRLSAAARAAGGPSAGGGIGGGNAASFIPYVGSGASSSPAAERAYQQAASSAAQQAASNPLFQKYRVADLTKQYNEAKTPEERTNIGMQIWAQTNPQLAAKLKQGQAGYAEAHSAPGMSNAGGYTLPSLPLSSSSFTAATQMQSPVTLEQNFGAPFPGVGMVSANPAAFKPQPGQAPYATKLDMQQTFGGPGTFDPAALNITQDQRRALINQYAQGLVNKPFPPAAK